MDVSKGRRTSRRELGCLGGSRSGAESRNVDTLVGVAPQPPRFPLFRFPPAWPRLPPFVSAARELVPWLSSLFVPFCRLVHFPHWRVVAYQFGPLHPSEGRCPAVSEGCIRVPHRSRRASPCFALLLSHTLTHTHTPARAPGRILGWARAPHFGD